MSLLTEFEGVAPDPKSDSHPPKDNSEIVIQMENVSVVYRAPSEHIKTLKEYAIRLLKGQLQHQEFCALNDVNLELRRGEVFGLVGHNGAGKSTMLKVLSRVMKPTRGRVWVKGRVAPLLELGAGFHHELSGRENILLNGTLLGYSRAQIEDLFDSIVEFAELEEFIDAPLRTYSTGMTVRLGFAVATAIRPDILIVDEVLAVGDEAFQQKCSDRITDFRRQGTTILLVTHSSATVENICNRAALLDHGRLLAVGEPADIIDQYKTQQRQNAEAAEEAKSVSTQIPLAKSVSSAIVPPEILEMEQEVLKRKWFYQYTLPSGASTESTLQEIDKRIHGDRLAMVDSVLRQSFGEDFSKLSCLDAGCNQGYFAIEMAKRGFRKVLGFDARQKNVEDAILIRRIYQLENLRFRVAQINKTAPTEIGQFDVVLMLSVLFWLENPIGALRMAKAMTRKMLILETPVAPDFSGEIAWGSKGAKKTLNGSFALLDQTVAATMPIGSLTKLSLCPGRETLLWTLQKVGFTDIEIVPVPSGFHEQLVSGNRIMIVARV